MEKSQGLLSAGFSVWVSICVFVCLWLWSIFTKGRRRFQTNLHVIEEGLRRMQADIELRQRENSIGCVEDVEDISEFLKKFYDEGNTEKTQDESQTSVTAEEKSAVEKEEKENETKGDEEKVVEVVEDKKRV